ncbi:WbqC family protein [uncultured Desulfosarcina sp.]|uniref:WbqC family protein n=1 Tax=uncultured Desulfosarcina sp. TaxID=218289 RepID=UPI0029C674C4|nr:WbqC family protein [uncultured Desulfosarcina sp.]
MKLAVMQPYFFPYIGYFQLLNFVDKWVVFDDTQFINKGWINRNRILHPEINKEWQYITIPLKNRKQTDRIDNIEIFESGKWKKEILGKLSAYRKKAPFYNNVLALIKECLSFKETNLSKFVVHTLQLTADYLSIKTPMCIQSHLHFDLSCIDHPGQWVLRIAEQIGATEYINPHGGAKIYREDEFDRSGINLRFLKPKLRSYSQQQTPFIPGLSVIDVMMWNSVNEIKEVFLQDFSIVKKSDLSANR